MVWGGEPAATARWSSDQRGDVLLVRDAEQRLAVDLLVDQGVGNRVAAGGVGVAPDALQRADLSEARGAVR